MIRLARHDTTIPDPLYPLRRPEITAPPMPEIPPRPSMPKDPFVRIAEALESIAHSLEILADNARGLG